MNNLELLGERLHTIRRRRGLTLKALAERAGTSYATVSLLERNRKPQITFDVVTRLADALRVSLDYLAGRKEDEAIDASEGASVGQGG